MKKTIKKWEDQGKTVNGRKRQQLALLPFPTNTRNIAAKEDGLEIEVAKNLDFNIV